MISGEDGGTIYFKVKKGIKELLCRNRIITVSSVTLLYVEEEEGNF